MKLLILFVLAYVVLLSSSSIDTRQGRIRLDGIDKLEFVIESFNGTVDWYVDNRTVATCDNDNATSYDANVTLKNCSMVVPLLYTSALKVNAKTETVHYVFEMEPFIDRDPVDLFYYRTAEIILLPLYDEVIPLSRIQDVDWLTKSYSWIATTTPKGELTVKNPSYCSMFASNNGSLAIYNFKAIHYQSVIFVDTGMIVRRYYNLRKLII